MLNDIDYMGERERENYHIRVYLSSIQHKKHKKSLVLCKLNLTTPTNINEVKKY
jgi:hypothetical protein